MDDEWYDFKIGDFVLWTLDGDIGTVVDIDWSQRESNDDLTPYYIEWLINPNQSGWHGERSNGVNCLIPL